MKYLQTFLYTLITVSLFALYWVFSTPKHPSTIEIVSNFHVQTEKWNQIFHDNQINAQVTVKMAKDYSRKFKKKRGILSKIARYCHLIPHLESKETRKLVFFNLNPSYCKKANLSRFSHNKLILFMYEPPVVLRKMYRPEILKSFRRVYTWDDDLVDNQKFFKFYYPVLTPMLTDIPSFEDKKLCTMVSSNLTSKHPLELYSERLRVIEYFEKLNTSDFEFYGHKWSKETYANYRGTCSDKLQTIKQYRFSICYENMRDIKGYVTEKIFDCFAAGSIPVYWGASNVTETIPKECFIDRRDFSSLDDLYAFLKAMTQEEYNGYLGHIQAYLNSDQAKLYSQENYEKIFCEAIRRN